MSDRDTFAAAALTGLIACMKDETVEDVCESAYGWADAILRERGVTEPMPKEKRAEVSYTLTAEELEAVKYAELTLRCETHPVCERHTTTLRQLLARLA